MDFSNAVVVFTSNVGSQDILEAFDQGGSADLIRGKVTGALSENFRPEFLNRLDEIVVFDPLDKEQLSDVLETMLREVYDRAEKEDLRIALSDGLKEEIIQAGAADARFGARPLRRAVQRFVEDVIAEGFARWRCGPVEAYHAGLWRRSGTSDPKRQTVLCCTSRRCFVWWRRGRQGRGAPERDAESALRRGGRRGAFGSGRAVRGGGGKSKNGRIPLYLGSRRASSSRGR